MRVGLRRLDGFLGRWFQVLLLCCMALGVLFPGPFSVLSRYTIYLFAVCTFASSLGAGFRDLGAVFLRPAPLAVTLVLLHILTPLVALGVGRLFFPQDPYLVTGMVLEFSIPTGVLSLMWVSVARGNDPLSLSIVLLDTLLTPVVLPLLLRLFVGASVELDFWGMLGDLMKMVAIPALIALALFHVLGRARCQTMKGDLAPVSKLLMLVITLANTSGIADNVRHMTAKLWGVMIVALLLGALAFALGYLAARLLRADYPTQASMTLNTGLRNISAGAVLAAQYFPAETLFPVICASLFMQLLASLAVTLLGKTAAGRAFAEAHKV